LQVIIPFGAIRWSLHPSIEISENHQKKSYCTDPHIIHAFFSLRMYLMVASMFKYLEVPFIPPLKGGGLVRRGRGREREREN